MNPILMLVWGVLAACFLGLLLYRGQLTRYEDEQLFLNDEANVNEQERQSFIVRRVKQLEPLINGLGGAAALATACVVGIYVYHAWQQIQ